MDSLLEITISPSGARTATFTSNDLINNGAKGIRLCLDVTAASGTTPTLDVKLQSKDSLSGQYLDITGAAFAQKIAISTDDFVIYAGVATTASRRVSDILPKVWRVVFTIGGTTPSFTFTLGGCYLI